MSVLEVQGLKKSYTKGFIPKKVQVLHGVDFKLKTGAITGFLGGNGAGKTTTLKCILNLAFADEGQVLYFGKNYLSRNIKKRIGFLPERPYFYEHLTGEEFLRFYGQLSFRLTTTDLKQKIDFLLKRVDLIHARDRKLRNYSKGMLQKIGVAQALIHDPELVILDEPMSGLDPDGRFYLSEIIRETAREGRTVFFSSHLLNDAEKLCEELVIMKSGRVTYQGTTEAFLQKMGEAALLTVQKNGRKEILRAHSQAELQAFLSREIAQGAQVIEVKQDRNLEEAFIRMGLRGD